MVRAVLEYAVPRERMVKEQLECRGIKAPRVLRALGEIPRHRFVDEAFVARAYGDYPLPIGEGQTISQPYMVGLMTEALELCGDERVLEIGTGSGYQTAVLAELAGKVFSVERLKRLADRAVRILDELGIYNVLVRVGDGSVGWPEEAPFDAVLVTAGGPAIPEALLGQVALGGRFVMPVGDTQSQVLRKGVRTPDGIRWADLGDCVFVKLIGKQGWPGDA
jgi:protein-L-isoaspartate(D-aspartate) O-methyltransferase